MPDDLARSLTAIAERLLAQAAERLAVQASADPELRAHLRQLAQAVLEATSVDNTPASVSTSVESSRVSSATVEEDPPISDVSDQIVPPPPAAPSSTAVTEPLPELTLGMPAQSVEPFAPSYASRRPLPSDADLVIIESRCRLKSEGTRWAASRRRLIAEGAVFEVDIEPIDREIIAKAKALPDCFLWMCNAATAPTPSDVSELETVGRCFDVLADALTLMRTILNEPDRYPTEFEQCLDLLAEAQSALRTAIIDIDGPVDADQMHVHNWLKATTNEHHVFIQRYMRTNDPADPSQREDLSARIEAVDSAMQESLHRDRKHRKLMGKIAHKLSEIAINPDAAEGHWEILVRTADELVSDGLPPSNRELRELLAPAIDRLPELSEIPRGFALVLREIDRFLAMSPSPEIASDTQSAPEVREVAELLKGRSLVLIGGERRRGSEQNLKEAFNLRELIWVGTREHQSIDGFEPSIARPDVAVVLLAIRWCSHSHGDVKDFCDRYGKPLVRLPTGYSPNQVAMQIMSQCSERLRAK